MGDRNFWNWVVVGIAQLSEFSKVTNDTDVRGDFYGI